MTTQYAPAGGPPGAAPSADTPTASTALVPFLGGGDGGTDAWVRMHKSDRRRLAMEAARGKDTAVLLSLTEAWLRTYSKAGVTIATGTIKNHTHGVRTLLAAWTEEDLLKPDAEAANRYVRLMERQGLKPGTIYGRVAAARALFSALRWARASLYDPFADVHVPHDPTPPWEKRRPYDDDEIAALLAAAAAPVDRVLVLLGAHGGLRTGECVRLQWCDVNLTRRDLTIRLSKGGKTRTVGMSASVKQALQGLPRRPDGFVLPYRTPKTAWEHMTKLCEVASVAPKGMHSLRHSAGTRLYAETGDLEETARHLGHTKLDTTRIYAKWNDRKLRETLSRW